MVESGIGTVRMPRASALGSLFSGGSHGGQGTPVGGLNQQDAGGAQWFLQLLVLAGVRLYNSITDTVSARKLVT